MLRLLTVALAVSAAWGDIYMHNPAGSNNRNRELNQNRNNANRLFDSQNNGAGGYPWRGDRTLAGQPDPMVYYEGSLLRVEWTQQHSCGENPNAHCQVVLQYACEDTMPGLRDGYPRQGDPLVNVDNADYQRAAFVVNNQDGTNTIPENNAEETEFGMHENLTYYRSCQRRTRNMGLYTADRRLAQNNARFTRQNPGGARHGFECAEERDYYPYWQPTPWKDIAVLTSNVSWCDYYRAHSENVKPREYCVMSEQVRQDAPNRLVPIERGQCTGNGGQWRSSRAHDIPAPECKLHDFSRDNHLGNVLDEETGQPEMSHYWWKMPQLPTGSTEMLCVLRARYNISTNDYPSMAGMTSGEVARQAPLFDHRFNCPRVNENGRTQEGDEQEVAGAADESVGCSNVLGSGNRPRFNRPYVRVFEGEPELSIALNTDQAGRTFQDRSYVFKIKRRPDGVSARATIWNLNTRGKRGNIVQTFPSVEYDFVPAVLRVKRGDYVHVQWTGSDFNVARQPNDAEGWRRSDRFNIVQVASRNHQIPLPASEQTMWGGDIELAKRLALLRQTNCRTFKAGDANENDHPENCGKLNAAPAHFDAGLVQITVPPGTYHYVSTRNNNFSNRSQKGALIVEGVTSSSSRTAVIIIAVVASVATVAALSFVAVKQGWLRLPQRRTARPLHARPTPRARPPPPPPPRPEISML